MQPNGECIPLDGMSAAGQVVKLGLMQCHVRLGTLSHKLVIQICWDLHNSYSGNLGIHS